jgi:hypothetical protein
MSEDSPPQNSGDEKNSRFFWVMLALFPGIIGILAAHNFTPNALVIVLIVNVFCSLFSGIGILGGMKDPAARIFGGLLLAGLFFVLNAGIVLFIDCSKMRIG